MGMPKKKLSKEDMLAELTRCDWKNTVAARRLGVSAGTFVKQFYEYNLGEIRLKTLIAEIIKGRKGITLGDICDEMEERTGLLYCGEVTTGRIKKIWDELKGGAAGGVQPPRGLMVSRSRTGTDVR